MRPAAKSTPAQRLGSHRGEIAAFGGQTTNQSVRGIGRLCGFDRQFIWQAKPYGELRQESAIFIGSGLDARQVTPTIRALLAWRGLASPVYPITKASWRAL